VPFSGAPFGLFLTNSDVFCDGGSGGGGGIGGGGLVLEEVRH
jgi:ribonuclease HI